MSRPESELIAQQGKFSLWQRQNHRDGEVVIVYEVRRSDELIEEFENQRDARSALELQDRLEVQSRAFGPGM